MPDFRDMARDPKYRRRFEKLLYLACKRGDADLVAERLSWGIDPNCTSAKGRTPLIANVRGSCPSAATARALLDGGAHPRVAGRTRRRGPPRGGGRTRGGRRGPPPAASWPGCGPGGTGRGSRRR